MRSNLAWLIVVSLIGGCSPGTWIRPDKTQADSKMDWAACNNQAASVGINEWSASFVTAANWHSYMNACMESKGYKGVYPWD